MSLKSSIDHSKYKLPRQSNVMLHKDMLINDFSTRMSHRRFGRSPIEIRNSDLRSKIWYKSLKKR